MKKKIILLLCILTMAMSLVGCSEKKVSNEAKVSSETESSLIKNAEVVLINLTQLSDDDMDKFRNEDEFNLEYIMMYYGIPTSGEKFLGLLDSWQSAEKECGQFVGYDIEEYKTKKTKDGYEVSIEAEFEDRDVTLVFIFDEKMNIETLDVSAEYDKSEIFKKASLNTLLGMGDVCAALIVLAFLISLLKHTNIISNLFESKSQSDVLPMIGESVKTDDIVIEKQENLNLSNDAELVAAIAAAIAAYEGTSVDGFVVRSIRRRTSNNWI